VTLNVSVFSIATNVYFDYWLELHKSASRNLFPDATVTFHVFTNIVPTYEQSKDLGENVITHRIEDLRWPEATITRYEIIAKEMSKVITDVIVYLDADMLINETIALKEIFDHESDSMVLVRHPGYWRPPFREDKTFYLRHLFLAISDLVRRLIIGGIGSWESNEKSTSFVKRSDRRFYYCGGFWMGKKEAIISFAEAMYQNVSKDLDNNVMAIWHDESHLNKWATTNAFRTHSPSYCFAEGFGNLDRLPKKIIAVTKTCLTR
jgi:hypothetical protein